MEFPESALLVLIPGLVAFVLSASAFPFYIRWLQHKQIGQYIREEGPQSHATKAKTPTMGGLCFIAITTIVSIVYILVIQYQFFDVLVFSPFAHPARAACVVIAIAALCGLVGFADDYGKVTSKSNRGLSAKSRLLIEFALGGLLGGVLWWLNSVPTPGFADNFPNIAIYIDYAYIFLFVPFLVAATTNAVNLHDGMDGLSSGTSVMVFITIAIMLVVKALLPLAGIAACIAGALAGFLIFNRNPAKVFMGDTGSLYIGGLMAALVTAGGLPLWFIPLSLIYVAETVSVFSQIVYFKLTKEYTPEKPMSKLALIKLKLTKRLPGEGKRLFRMAPLHHHFEAIAEDKGIPEWKVVSYFWYAQFAICAITLALFFTLYKPPV